MYLWRSESHRTTQRQDQKYSPGDERERTKPVLMLLSVSEWAEELSWQACSSHCRGVWFPLKVSPVGRTGLRAALRSGRHKASNCHERETDSNGKFSLLTEAHAALKLSTASHNKSTRNPACFKPNHFWFIINNNNVHLQKMQSRLLMAEALGKKKDDPAITF